MENSFGPKILDDININDLQFDNPVKNDILKLYAMCLGLIETLTPEQMEIYEASSTRHFSRLQLTVAPKKDDDT